jgi:hypothetical protein
LRDQISAMKKINPLSGLQNSLSDISSSVAGPMATPPGANVQASVGVQPQSSPEPRKDELKA